jgi:hypothetical protein
LVLRFPAAAAEQQQPLVFPLLRSSSRKTKTKGTSRAIPKGLALLQGSRKTKTDKGIKKVN